MLTFVAFQAPFSLLPLLLGAVAEWSPQVAADFVAWWPVPRGVWRAAVVVVFFFFKGCFFWFWGGGGQGGGEGKLGEVRGGPVEEVRGGVAVCWCFLLFCFSFFLGGDGGRRSWGRWGGVAGGEGVLSMGAGALTFKVSWSLDYS